MASGGVLMKELSSTFVCSIRLLPQIPASPLLPPIVNMRNENTGLRTESTGNEHGSFTPLIMSSTGGVGSAANVCYKRLASLLSVKWNLPYACTLYWIQCILSFTLLRSSIQCIRATRWLSTSLKHPCHLTAYYEAGIANHNP